MKYIFLNHQDFVDYDLGVKTSVLKKKTVISQYVSLSWIHVCRTTLSKHFIYIYLYI